MRTLRLTSSILVLALPLAMVGCGDDEDGHGGPVDGGGDANMGQTDGSVDGGVAVCPPGECDLAAQDCGSGQGCYFAAGADGGAVSPMCATEGMGALGTECMDANDCSAGLFCLGPTGMMGTCRGVCCLGSDDPCPSGTECLIPVTAAGPSDTGVGACAVPNECDLLGSDCGPSEGCYPSIKPGVTVCVAGGDLTEGESCNLANDCAPGLICTDGECTKLCDRSGGTSGCDATQDCVELIGFASPVGVCDPPLSP